MTDANKPVALEPRAAAAGNLLFSPSVARNREPILAVLRPLLPEPGKVLEIASGTGEHAAFVAKAMPGLDWQPSDPDAASRASIAGWIAAEDLANVRSPLDIDVRADVWGVEARAPFDAVLSINMIHIAPWPAAVGLFEGAGRLLGPKGVLILYGPFMRDGVHSAASNEAFDASLKSRNPEWGVRDIADLERLAQAQRLVLRETAAMPANNRILVFARA